VAAALKRGESGGLSVSEYVDSEEPIHDAQNAVFGSLFRKEI
jgi:hypothetical protein